MTTPTSKALEEAVERLAEEMASAAGFNWKWRVALGSPEVGKFRDAASASLAKAFPGLFNGTMWLAPWEATEEMRSACRELTDPIYSLLPGEHLDYDPEDCVFAAMRDAYLNAERME